MPQPNCFFCIKEPLKLLTRTVPAWLSLVPCRERPRDPVLAVQFAQTSSMKPFLVSCFLSTNLSSNSPFYNSDSFGTSSLRLYIPLQSYLPAAPEPLSPVNNSLEFANLHTPVSASSLPSVWRLGSRLELQLRSCETSKLQEQLLRS